MKNWKQSLLMTITKNSKNEILYKFSSLNDIFHKITHYKITPISKIYAKKFHDI